MIGVDPRRPPLATVCRSRRVPRRARIAVVHPPIKALRLKQLISAYLRDCARLIAAVLS
jgi:hypothetical protein